MNDTRNLILAIALSLVVLLGWSAVTEALFPTAQQPSTKFEDGKQIPQQQPASLPTATPETPTTVRDRAQVMAESPRLPIETPSLKGSINLKGARIDDLVLTRHTETIAQDSAPSASSRRAARRTAISPASAGCPSRGRILKCPSRTRSGGRAANVWHRARRSP